MTHPWTTISKLRVKVRIKYPPKYRDPGYIIQTKIHVVSDTHPHHLAIG